MLLLLLWLVLVVIVVVVVVAVVVVVVVHLMEEPSGLLGALDVQVAEFLVVQWASCPALSLHLNQVSIEIFVDLKSFRK